jgi:hypothetical protein
VAKIKGKQLNQLVGQAHWNTTGIAIPSAASVTVTTAFAGKVSGGSNSVVGVFTTNPNNKIFLRESATGKALASGIGATAKSVFGRLTESAGTWTLSFFTLVAGVETAYDFAAGYDSGAHPLAGDNFDFRWCESVQIADSAPTAIVYAGEGIDEFDPSSPTNHNHIQETVAVTSNGQTGFALSQTPKDVADVIMTVNGVRYEYGSGKDYTIAGSTVTWLDVDFTLQTTDEVIFSYEY